MIFLMYWDWATSSFIISFILDLNIYVCLKSTSLLNNSRHLQPHPPLKPYPVTPATAAAAIAAAAAAANKPPVRNKFKS